jgi:hypothetical protein
MAGLKKETARIDLPVPSIRPHEAGRIQLPLSESLDKEPLHTPTEPQPDGGSAVQDGTSTGFFAPSEPPSISMPLSASVKPSPDSTSLQDPSIAAQPAGKNSMLLMWILLGASALILIIQIWTYFS